MIIGFLEAEEGDPFVVDCSIADFINGRHNFVGFGIPLPKCRRVLYSTDLSISTCPNCSATYSRSEFFGLSNPHRSYEDFQLVESRRCHKCGNRIPRLRYSIWPPTLYLVLKKEANLIPLPSLEISTSRENKKSFKS
jgi:hypothetical protein